MNRARTVILLALASLAATAARGQDWRGPASLAVEVKGKPRGNIEGALVILRYQQMEPPAGPRPVLTDASGRAVVADLAPGVWEVEVSHEEFLSFVALVVLDGGRKPTVQASFLQASGSSLTPIRVKFMDGRGRTPSPSVPLPPEAAARLAARQPPPRPAPRATEEPRVATRKAPEPVMAEPELRPLPPTAQPTAEPAPPAAEEPAPEPVPESPAAVSSEGTVPPVLPAPTPEPEPAPAAGVPTSEAMPEPAAPPSPEAMPEPAEPPSPEATPEPAEPVPPPEPPAMEAEPEPTTPPPPRSETATPPAPPSEPATPPAPPSAPVAPSGPTAPPEAKPAPPSPPPAPAPPPPAEAPAPPATEPAPSAPEAAAPEPPAAAPTVPSPQPSPAPEPPAPAAVLPPPGPLGPTLRAYRDRTCIECRPGEWALSVETVLGPRTEACDEAALAADGARLAELLGGSIALELKEIAAPAPQAVGQMEPGEDATRAAELLGDASSGCRIVALVIPKAGRFRGLRMEAADASGVGDCQADRPCPVGKARWLGQPRVAREPSTNVIWGLFVNDAPDRARRARLTVYFAAPSRTWDPPR